MNVLLLASEPKPRAELEVWLDSGGHQVRAGEPPLEEGWRADVVVFWLPRLLEPALGRCMNLRNFPQAESARVLGLGCWHDLGEIRSLLQAGLDDYLAWPTDACTFGLRLLVLEQDRTRYPLTEDQRRLAARIAKTQKGESLAAVAGGIAHDFNNLLAAILGNAELALLDLSPQSPIRYSLEQIEKASRRAGELTRQMLTYSHRSAVEFGNVDLNELVLEMSELLRTSISKRSRVEFEFALRLPAIRGEASQLRQVVMNLLINASEAAGERGGVILLRTTEVESGAGGLEPAVPGATAPPGRYVQLEVRDSGQGMSPEVRARIFDPFFTTKKSGRGLGLAAVLGIVRNHQGEVHVESEMGRGSVFRLLFPAVEAEEAMLNKRDDPLADWQGEGTILLVDDEDAVREAARRVLEKAGYTVLAVNSGEQGLEVFGDLADDISAVILDLSMPGMDGLEVFGEIRRQRPGMRVIVWSGFDAQDMRARFSAYGTVQFIEKPSHVRDLALALKQALQPA